MDTSASASKRMKRAEAGEAESVSKSEAETEAETEAVTNTTAAGMHPSTFAALNELATPPPSPLPLQLLH